jgi:hypothetical protein
MLVAFSGLYPIPDGVRSVLRATGDAFTRRTQRSDDRQIVEMHARRARHGVYRQPVLASATRPRRHAARFAAARLTVPSVYEQAIAVNLPMLENTLLRKQIHCVRSVAVLSSCRKQRRPSIADPISFCRRNMRTLVAACCFLVPAGWYLLYSAGLLDERSVAVLVGATLAVAIVLRRRVPVVAIVASLLVALTLSYDAQRAVSFDGPLDDHVVVEGDAAYLLEPITRATPAQLRLTLAAHPGLRRVLLGSDGGNAMAGVQLARLIRARGLNTETAPDFLCQSACTYAFAGGVQRTAASGCPLRFHAEGGALPPVAAVMTRIHHAVLDLPPHLAAAIRATGPGVDLLRINSVELRDRDGFVTQIDPGRPPQPC